MKPLSLIRRGIVLTIAGIGYHLWRESRSGDLNGQVVLITGASRGLGLLLARAFAQQGCQVAICARVQEELAQAQAQLQAWGVQVFALTCDVSDQAEVNGMIETVMQRYGRVDILVNNAGTIQVTPIQSATLDDFKQALDTMLWGGLHTTLALLPHMQARRQGRIVNITSIGGKVAVPHLLPYVAAKFAMTGFSEGLSAELSGSGIQVTTVIPGLMRTGSYLNAFFKGHHQDEFRWFSVGDNLPFISIDAEVAAQEIVEATRRGDTEYVLTIPAKILTRFYGLLPNLAIRLIGLTTRLVLPGATRNPVLERGMEIQARMREPLLNWLTQWGRSAARRFNQHSAPPYEPHQVETATDFERR
jgi:NAD(P)-dependent dehydrogenase (short-subunit alcohol dehydrogenase family)